MEKGGYDDGGGAAAQAHASAGEAPEANGGCFACGGDGRAVEGAPSSCRAALCGRGCAIAFNCSDDPTEMRWATAHSGAASPDAGQQLAIAGWMVDVSRGEPRARHAVAALGPRSVLWPAHVDPPEWAQRPRARRARQTDQRRGRRGEGRHRSLFGRGLEPTRGLEPRLGVCAAASSSGQGTRPLGRQQFLVVAAAAPDDDSMVAGGSAREPRLECAVLLAAVSGDPHPRDPQSNQSGAPDAVRSAAAAAGIGCATSRHGRQKHHVTFVSRRFNSSLGTFVEERSTRDARLVALVQVGLCSTARTL